ncbi:YbhB/YbcL family Raf kinase inhibitor-like protein [Kluyveromyces lactis]|uniref:KLLA0C01738p n=1 Tax=Kluyveromyces lactis (strain ATCC 8585 / CBS 2359 / DSM 70799 / NBRC 1267 / NRRL Y-1140 / WM37) TaxID=284590 RepID=Q6CUW6_KLULA|nr:uncharacterized protein KLLA0_C01738g [Kluyveromyces lactis]CAH01124.1 KLLA0C01738p [Kluyveromyces lactis]|eukprot:XP_452273.1 uncharacterized protein KLLA0_C01738g [Kluyveromyces lactis]
MFASINSAKAIKDSLTSHGVISKVLPDFSNKGSTSLVIEYASKHPVALGNTLSIDGTQEKPEIKVAGGNDAQLDTDALYSLCLTDPDAPSNSDNKWSEYCHYLETNIKLSLDPDTPMSLDLKAGDVQLPYVGPAPPKGTGPHRYVWILAQQSPDKKPESVSDRPNWGFKKPGTGFQHYAELFNLTPVAVNFFYAENK